MAISELVDFEVAVPRHGQGRLLAPWLIVGLLAIQAAAVTISRLVLPLDKSAPPLGVTAQLLSWDGRWYNAIASSGYSWNPVAYASQQQSIAFFPAQPLIDRAAIALGGSAAVPLIIILSLLFGLASIVVFERLARAVLSPHAVPAAVACYALWPASSFYLMGYPTGLISLCIIAALADHIDGRVWRSAGWLGLGTAVNPTVVFVGMALGLAHALAWVQSGARLGGLLRLVLWGLLALFGLLGFMFYQFLAFHDAFAFIDAQAGWGAAPSLQDRMLNLIDLKRYLQQSHAGVNEIGQGSALLHEGQMRAGAALIAMGIQRLINFVAFLVVFIGLIGATFALRGRARVIAAAGWIVFIGYLWTIFTTGQNLLCVPRLLFPAIAVFLGLGALIAKLPTTARVSLVGGLALLSFVEAAFAAVGFWVV